jgi:uncharacterized membrane protein YadS
VWLGKTLGVDLKLTELPAAGTSICGAFAVLATDTVTDGTDEGLTYTGRRACNTAPSANSRP